MSNTVDPLFHNFKPEIANKAQVVNKYPLIENAQLGNRVVPFR